MSVRASEVSPAFDETRAEQFAGRISATLDQGAIAAMISLGHRAGLFDVLAGLPPSTSATVARHARLHERYVREWLAAMVTGGIVEYFPATRTYVLPAEHAASLSRGGHLGNFAVFAQHVALMGRMEERVLECFRTGNGTRYSEYPCFHSVMEEDSGQTVTARLIDTILPLAPDVVRRLEQGIEVLDAGCGRGSALIAMARRFPNSRFVGYDLGADAVAHARDVARAAAIGNVQFEVRDLAEFREPCRYAFVTSFDAVHDQRDPGGLVRRLYEALRPGGTYLMQDIGGSARLEQNLDFPMAAFLYAVSCIHCTPVSIGQGGPGLGTMWGWETAEAMLREAGFAEVVRHVLPHDPMNVWFVARKST